MKSDHGENIVKAFQTIEKMHAALYKHIREDLFNFPIWLFEVDQFIPTDKEKLIFVLNHFSPSPGLKAQETFGCPGAVACLPDTLYLIHEVNKAKDEMKRLVAKIKLSLTGDVLAFVRKNLTHSGYPAIKLKQVYRHIKFINYHPRRIAWTKGKHNSSVKLSKIMSEKLLSKAGQGKHIDVQLAKLRLLEEGIHLVKHRAIKPCWIANISTFKINSRSLHEDIRSSLPVFYIQDPNRPPPVVCLSNKSSRQEIARIDKKIENAPFLPSISAYRYKIVTFKKKVSISEGV